MQLRKNSSSILRPSKAKSTLEYKKKLGVDSSSILEWRHVEERLQARLSSWKGKLLSLGGRLVLIISVLTNMVLYMII